MSNDRAWTGVMILFYLVVLLTAAGYARHRQAVEASQATVRPIAVTRPQVTARSAVLSEAGRTVYRVDVCAVADSAAGEDFRTEVR